MAVKNLEVLLACLYCFLCFDAAINYHFSSLGQLELAGALFVTNPTLRESVDMSFL